MCGPLSIRLAHGLVVITGLAPPQEHHGAEPGRPLKHDYYLGRDGQGNEADSGVEGQQPKKTVDKIRAQDRPRLFARAIHSHRPAPISPAIAPPAT